MEKNKLKRTHKNKKSRQIGRGGVKAKTAGRGTKGQNARAGRKKRPELRDFIKRIPKLRGRGKNINTSIKSKPYTIDLATINQNFKDNDVVSPKTLKEKALVDFYKGKLPKVKILLNGQMTKKVIIEGCMVSSSVKDKVLKIGGQVK